MQGKIFRISHMGYVDHGDILVALSALEAVLAELGHPVRPGDAVRAAQEALRP
jgi:aspartate aminotransferase-like enzyme